MRSCYHGRFHLYSTYPYNEVGLPSLVPFIQSFCYVGILYIPTQQFVLVNLSLCQFFELSFFFRKWIRLSLLQYAIPS